MTDEQKIEVIQEKIDGKVIQSLKKEGNGGGNGYQLVKNVNLIEKKLSKMCRSKKKRVKKKWLKNSKNYSYFPEKNLFIDDINKTINGHPITIDQFIKTIKEKQKENTEYYTSNLLYTVSHRNGLGY